MLICLSIDTSPTPQPLDEIRLLHTTQIPARLQHMAERLEATPPTVGAMGPATSTACSESGAAVSYPIHLLSWRI